MKEQRLVNLPKAIRRRRVAMFRVGDGVQFKWLGRWCDGYIVRKEGCMFGVEHPDGAKWTVDVDDVSHKVMHVGWPGLYDGWRERCLVGGSWVVGQITMLEEAVNGLAMLSVLASDNQRSAINDLIRPMRRVLDEYAAGARTDRRTGGTDVVR